MTGKAIALTHVLRQSRSSSYARWRLRQNRTS